MRHDNAAARPASDYEDDAYADDDDIALSESAPEWFIPGVRPSLGEGQADDDIGLGFRSLLDEPDTLSEAWSSMA